MAVTADASSITAAWNQPTDGGDGDGAVRAAVLGTTPTWSVIVELAVPAGRAPLARMTGTGMQRTMVGVPVAWILRASVREVAVAEGRQAQGHEAGRNGDEDRQRCDDQVGGRQLRCVLKG